MDLSNRRRQIGVLGGSFNPVHIGHIMLASYIAQFSGLDQVWLMLSPANPLKPDVADMASDADRLAMLRMACRSYRGLKPCDIELSMPRPSYTIDSLNRLAAENPDCDFRLIIGSDNWQIFDRWRQHDDIIRLYRPIVYPRPEYPVDRSSLPEEVSVIDAPELQISSTFIRHAVFTGHDMKAFLPIGVDEYIRSHGLYISPLP